MSVTTTDPGGLLFTGAEWDFDTLARIHEAEREIAEGELGLDPWPSRIEVITSEQMLDAYASTGMPISYRHWSFGKEFVRNEELYRRGWQGLAYEPFGATWTARRRPTSTPPRGRWPSGNSTRSPSSVQISN